MTDVRPALLVTRPQAEAKAFVKAFGARVSLGRVVISPLMRIVATGTAPRLAETDAAVFTSAHGVACYAGANDRPAFCVGRKTAAAAAARGFAADVWGPDADALVAHLLKVRPARRLVHLRGTHARGEITGRLRAAGLDATEAVIYDQQEVPLTEEARALLNGTDPVLLPLFSPRSADILAAQIAPRAPLRIAAISPAVAERAAKLAPQAMEIAESPDQRGICTALAALYLTPSPLERG